jgi:hypothetical protein
LLLRNSGGALDELDEAAREAQSAAGAWAECPPETIANVFGSGDLVFVRAKGSDRLRRAFEHDRREIALHWVRNAFGDTRRIMSRHFKMVRSAPDLSLTLEAKLVAEFLLHQMMCVALIGLIRVAGPARLAIPARAIGGLRHHVGTVIEGFSEPARGDLAGGSGLRTRS